MSNSKHILVQIYSIPKVAQMDQGQTSASDLETLSKEFNGGLKTYDGSAITASFVRLFFSVVRNNRMYQNGYTLFHLAALNGILGYVS